MRLPVRPRLRGDVLVRQVEKDFALYDPVRDRTAVLSASAAAIILLCDGSRTAEEIAAEMRKAFSAETGIPLADVEAAIREFVSEGFLEPPDEPM